MTPPRARNLQAVGHQRGNLGTELDFEQGARYNGGFLACQILLDTTHATPHPSETAPSLINTLGTALDQYHPPPTTANKTTALQ